MKKYPVIYLSLLFVSGLIFEACANAETNIAETETGNRAVINQPENPPPEIESPKGETLTFTSGKADFQGVSFDYSQQIFGKAEAQEVADYFLQEETDKPDYVEPRHRLFTFDLSTGYSAMDLAVYPIDDFPRMYAVNQASVKVMTEEVNNFKKVLRDKNFRMNNKIPYLPFRDASQSFQVKVRQISFQGGKGILFLTFWDTEVELPSNRQLRYVFEGLTNDEKYYILAEMPVSVSFLPEKSSQEYEGYKIPWGKGTDFDAVMKHVKEINKKIAKRLENLSSNGYKPNLKEFEKMIASLKIEK